MLENSLSFMQDAPWLAIAPGVFITLTVLALTQLGETLRKALRPDA
jgi:ABC-type dipeptide/oligopeptide/nickel transport system permease subunit